MPRVARRAKTEGVIPLEARRRGERAWVAVLQDRYPERSFVLSDSTRPKSRKRAEGGRT